MEQRTSLDCNFLWLIKTNIFRPPLCSRNKNDILVLAFAPFKCWIPATWRESRNNARALTGCKCEMMNDDGRGISILKWGPGPDDRWVSVSAEKIFRLCSLSLSLIFRHALTDFSPSLFQLKTVCFRSHFHHGPPAMQFKQLLRPFQHPLFSILFSVKFISLFKKLFCILSHFNSVTHVSFLPKGHPVHCLDAFAPLTPIP